MNASNYVNYVGKKKLLLIAISVSGKTPRVLEVVGKVKKNFPDHLIIGATDNIHSELAKLVDNQIILGTSPVTMLESSDYKDGIAKLYTGYHHDVAQTKTYFGNILELISFFNHHFIGKNKTILQTIPKWIEKCELTVNQYPIKYPHKTIFIGSGLLESLAQFGQYKWFEYTFSAQHADFEEYAHTSYFITDQETTVIFFAPTGPLLNRMKEIIDGALGGLIQPQIIVITDTKISFDYNITVINVLEQLGDISNLISLDRELTYYLFALIIVEWYIYYTARSNGFDTNQFRGGKDGEKYVRGSYQTIRKSKIKI